MPISFLKKVAIPSNISTYLSRSMIIITVATTFLIGGVLIIQQTLYFQQVDKQKSEEYVRDQKIYIQEIVKNELEYIRLQDSAFKQRINDKVRANVLQAFYTAESVYQKYNGKKSDEEIKSLIVATISSLKFELISEEVFISSMDGFGVFYPQKPEMTNKDLREFKDSNGSPVVLNEINLLKKNNEGFLDYTHSSVRTSKTLPHEKITFIKKFGHYNWYFGSKQYIEDFFPKFRDEIAKKISSVRFRHGGYVFMNHIDGTPIVMDGKIYQGKVNLLSDSQSPRQKVFEEELQVVTDHPDGDFFYYKWNKIGETALSEKCSFAQLYKDYGWIIGAGFYLDELNKSIEDQQNALQSDQKKNILTIALILVLLLFLEAYIIYHFNKRYKADFEHFFRFFFMSKDSFNKLDVEKLYFEEFKMAGEAANEMIALREENEKKLIAEQKKATESDRLKSAFLANMSHEIRTPMNGILGFTGLLEDESQNEEDKLIFLKLIRKNGEILLNLINDIVDISKIESNLLVIKKKPFKLNGFIEDIRLYYTEILATTEAKNVRFAIENLVPKDFIIHSDQIRLRQILDNLIGNAIKFTSKGSVTLEVNLRDEMIHFRITDTGIGIAPSHQLTIFERFIQADHGPKNNFGGTGLGLAISKNLVELLGGSIGVKSEPGKGSTFFFSIPAN